MSAVAEWAAMGGYAGWVWSAWGLTALCIGGLAVLTLRRSAQVRARLAALEAEMAPKSNGPESTP